jgi:SPASM domain peptide maturase of grasp-with-spasm system
MKVLEKIKTSLQQLPLSFQYLGAIKEEQQSSNYNQVIYKPATIAALQTNSDVVGIYHKPVSRLIQPVATTKKNDSNSPTEQYIDSESEVTLTIDEKKYFKLFATCIPVKGASRSIICDLQRQFFHFIPNGLFEILSTEPKNLSQLTSTYGEENRETIIEYFKFLLQEEYGTWFTESQLSLFPPLSLEWKSPLQITNSIIDIEINSNYNVTNVLQQLDDLGCEAVQLRFFSSQSLTAITDIARGLLTSRIKSIDIFIPYNKSITSTQLITLANEHQRINNLIIYNSPESLYTNELNHELTRIIFTQENITSEYHCGVVKPDYFLVNTQLFLESNNHNNCLNRKISIDKNGLIKNCPSLPQSFGHITNVSLKEVLAGGAIKDKWGITKDKVAICKDCEFRYICTDCRAYTENINDPLSKPAKCNYDPYTAEWV